MSKYRGRWIVVLTLTALLFILTIRPIGKHFLRARLNSSIIQENWDQVQQDLSHFWNLSEGSSEKPDWFFRASADLLQLGSSELDAEAHATLIQWLVDQEAAGAARLLLDKSVVYIPEGSFWMGSDGYRDDERPMKTVSLSAYTIDRFEVTNLQYRAFLESEDLPSPTYWEGVHYPAAGALLPVVGVSWDQARAYCQWIGKRLPTEAEWEHSCRGDEGATYPWGDRWEASNANLGLSWSGDWPERFDDAWLLIGSPDQPGLEPVGSRPSGMSSFGVMDMIGNAAEWVLDWYNPRAYSVLPEQDPVSPGPYWNHSVRGNGWFSRLGWEGTVPEMSRCAARSSSHSYDDPRVGFRCAGD